MPRQSSRLAAKRPARNNCCYVCKDKKYFRIMALCEQCLYWVHPCCIGFSQEESEEIEKSKDDFFCNKCKGESNHPQEQGDLDKDQSVQEIEPSNAETHSPTSCPPTPGGSRAYEAGDSSADQYLISQTSPATDFPIDLNLSSSTLSPPDTPRSYTNILVPGSFDLSQTSDRPDHQDTSETANSTTDAQLSDSDTCEVVKVIGHTKDRQFRLLLLDGDRKWFKEKDCRDCIAKINEYCESNNLRKSHLPVKVGFSSGRSVKDNWISIEHAVHLARTYGIAGSLEPSELTQLGSTDGLLLTNVGTHCFTILFIAETKTCYISDGNNTYEQDGEVRANLINKLSGAKRIKHVRFEQQKGENHCGSSATAIASAFQYSYKNGEEPKHIRVAPSRLERLVKTAHPVPDTKINGRLPVNSLMKPIKCSNCGFKIKGKNPAALKLHKCKPEL